MQVLEPGQVAVLELVLVLPVLGLVLELVLALALVPVLVVPVLETVLVSPVLVLVLASVLVQALAWLDPVLVLAWMDLEILVWGPWDHLEVGHCNLYPCNHPCRSCYLPCRRCSGHLDQGVCTLLPSIHI